MGDIVTMTPGNIRSFAGLEIDTSDKVTSGLCMGIYGLGGSGKTTEMAKIVLSQHGTPALLVDIDGSSDAVLHLKKYGLDIVKPKNWKAFRRTYDDFKRGGHEYKSLIVDNLSVLVEMCMIDIVPSGARQIQHWGEMTARIQTIANEGKDMARLDGYNVLFVLWEEVEEDQLTKLTRRKVNLTAKLAATIPGIIPMMARITVPGDARDGYTRKLSFAPSERTDSKFRVAPTDAAASIPLELFVKAETNFLADFLATVKDGVKFPLEKYKSPTKTGN